MRSLRAVIDIGSNSIKYLVGSIDSTGAVQVKAERVEETRISTGISSLRPVISEQAISAAKATLAQFADDLRNLNVTEVIVVATSAVRDALNREDFAQMVSSVCGVPLRILTGEEEASYIARGVALDPQLQGMNAFILFDLGGGSLELGRFSGNQLERRCSLQLGAVRLKELLISDPKAPIDSCHLAEIEEYVDTQLEAEAVYEILLPDLPLIGLGGAVAVTSAMLDHIRPIPLNEIRKMRSQAATLPLHERKHLKGLPEARADIIVPAMIVIEVLMTRVRATTLTFSRYNLRYGLLAGRP